MTLWRRCMLLLEYLRQLGAEHMFRHACHLHLSQGWIHAGLPYGSQTSQQPCHPHLSCWSTEMPCTRAPTQLTLNAPCHTDCGRQLTQFSPASAALIGQCHPHQQRRLHQLTPHSLLNAQPIVSQLSMAKSIVAQPHCGPVQNKGFPCNPSWI